MTGSPYAVLGLSEGASMDEVKKAYRKKARENHPDLNPNDPSAADRMNEINEAYDRIMNPEKYVNKRKPGQGQTANPYANTGAAGQGGAYGYGYGYGDGGYGSTRQGTGGSQAGWQSDFDFNDFFNFGFGAAYSAVDPKSIHPEVSAFDSPQLASVINDINAGNYKRAAQQVMAIPSTGRNARWYYIAALANHGADNEMLAMEQARKAVQMEPGNQDYKRLLEALQRPSQYYQQQAQTQGFGMSLSSCAPCICGLLWLNTMTFCCCSPFRIGM